MSPEDWVGLRHQQQTVPFPFKITVRTWVGLFLKPTYCRGRAVALLSWGVPSVYNICRTTYRVDIVPVQYY